MAQVHAASEEIPLRGCQLISRARNFFVRALLELAFGSAHIIQDVLTLAIHQSRDTLLQYAEQDRPGNNLRAAIKIRKAWNKSTMDQSKTHQGSQGPYRDPEEHQQQGD
ncbi:hypothetical protein NKH18_27190 [Streptomyces sp. M10(2022)]